MDLDAVQRIVDAEAAGHEAIGDRAVAGVARAYDGLDWYDHEAITVAATQAGAVARASSQASVALADAAMTRVLTEVVGGSPRPAGALTVVAPFRQGVSGWSGVYGRVADTVRFEMSRGLSVDDAVAVGLERGGTLCRTDLGLARREQWRRSLTANPQVIGFRRVIHPELGKKVCGLCIAASSRIYTKTDLLPLHNGCRCTVSPITQVHDPGANLNDRDLKALYEQAGGTSRALLQRTRYEVQEHGELGPVLVNTNYRFRGPDEVAAARARRAGMPAVDVDAGRTVEQLRATLASQERAAEVFTSPGIEARIAELRAKIAART